MIFIKIHFLKNICAFLEFKILYIIKYNQLLNKN